jgi:hypothetical protein
MSTDRFVLTTVDEARKLIGDEAINKLGYPRSEEMWADVVVDMKNLSVVCLGADIASAPEDATLGRDYYPLIEALNRVARGE